MGGLTCFCAGIKSSKKIGQSKIFPCQITKKKGLELDQASFGENL